MDIYASIYFGDEFEIGSYYLLAYLFSTFISYLDIHFLYINGICYVADRHDCYRASSLYSL